MSLYDNVYYIHCTKPKTNDLNEQKVFFFKKIKEIKELYNSLILSPELIILDRSWLGEYVYGSLYRKNDKQSIINIIEECYKELQNLNYVTILLTCDNVDFCLKHSDKKSLSNDKKEYIINEINLFHEISLYDFINKPNIFELKVNDGLEFKDKDEIFNNVLSLIK